MFLVNECLGVINREKVNKYFDKLKNCEMSIITDLGDRVKTLDGEFGLVDINGAMELRKFQIYKPFYIGGVNLYADIDCKIPLSKEFFYNRDISIVSFSSDKPFKLYLFLDNPSIYGTEVTVDMKPGL